MKKVKLLFGIILGLLIMFSKGCQDVENDQLGHLVVKITDAPFPIDMISDAMVSITKVEIRVKSEGEDEEYPFITVLEEAMEFNLLELRNGVTAICLIWIYLPEAMILFVFMWTRPAYQSKTKRRTA